MFTLVSRVPVGLTELRSKFEYHVRSQGIAGVEKCGEGALNVSVTTALLWVSFRRGGGGGRGAFIKIIVLCTCTCTCTLYIVHRIIWSYNQWFVFML